MKSMICTKESKVERSKWRLILFGILAFYMSVIGLSTHIFGHETLISLKNPILKTLSRSADADKPSVIERRNLLDLGDCQGTICSNGDDISNCTRNPNFEFACCVFEHDGEQFEFEDSPYCETKSGEICSARNLCVAELIPGFTVGAECLSYFESVGGIPFYTFLLLYIFLAQAIVCDDYFTYSLDQLADTFSLTSDVKGATFAAIGSSAPELFVSIADNVISNPPKSVGIGTIVGSAIFNILVIIGASAVVAGHKFSSLDLDWKPLTRDSLFYAISICALIGVAVSGNEAKVYEGLFFILLYILYLTFLYFNEGIFKAVDITFNKKSVNGELPEDKIDDNEGNVSQASSNSRGSALAKGRVLEIEELEHYFSCFFWPMYETSDTTSNTYLSKLFGGGYKLWCKRGYYLFVLPINILFRFTIPDARYDLFCEDRGNKRNKRCKLYWTEFSMCIFWIAVLTHFLVFSAAKFGCLVGIDPAVMGLTILAAGTSIPDMITSVLLTLKGEGDAAVANSIGSNVFDILIGLGLPWALAGLIYSQPSGINTGELAVAISFLFGVLIILVLALFMTRFKLNIMIGSSLLVLYILYVLFELFLRKEILG